MLILEFSNYGTLQYIQDYLDSHRDKLNEIFSKVKENFENYYISLINTLKENNYSGPIKTFKNLCVTESSTDDLKNKYCKGLENLNQICRFCDDEIYDSFKAKEFFEYLNNENQLKKLIYVLNCKINPLQIQDKLEEKYLYYQNLLIHLKKI